jgi:hypothetical protein
MTTSEPEAGRRADDPREDRLNDGDSREHRGLGQRLRDAVLGEPVETRDDAGREAVPESDEPGRHHVEPERVPTDEGRDADAGDRDSDRLDTGLTDAAAAPGQQAGRADTGTERTGNPDARAAGAGTSDSTGPDFVTSSYDPNRDTGYDPRAAGTAMAGDEARNYDPAADTGYVDQDRTETDRVTGHRDADYDTGRVDASRDGGDGGASGHSAGAAGGVVAGAVAGAAATGHRDRTDADDRAGEVDTDGRATGTPDDVHATDDRTGGQAGDRAAAIAAESQDSSGRERLIPADRAHDYSSRWDLLKGDFVDEPRRAVRQADELVGELLDEVQQLFARQRRDLEQGLDNDQASTEDLRLGLRRYRSFFDRLLSF